MSNARRRREGLLHQRFLIRVLVDLLASLLVLAGGGCGRSMPTPAAREDALTIFAAASLRDVFTAMGNDFERAHPGVELTFNFAGSQQLRTQLEHGAAADVFASADRRDADALVRASRALAPVVFARNELVIVVTAEAATSIRTLADLPSAPRIVVGTPEVPIGRYTLEILDRASPTLGADFRARVEAKVATRELNVRQVLAKVSLGEAEVGVVYRTDALAAGDRVRVVMIPRDINVIAEYPIAVVTGAVHPGLARAWLDFVLSVEGQRTLRSAGFLSPAEGGSAP